MAIGVAHLSNVQFQQHGRRVRLERFTRRKLRGTLTAEQHDERRVNGAAVANDESVVRVAIESQVIESQLYLPIAGHLIEHRLSTHGNAKCVNIRAHGKLPHEVAFRTR